MDPLQPGDPAQVGSYRLLGRLGAGGMGQVFFGRSPGGRPVAVKLIRPEHAGNEQFRTRFAREVEAARSVGGFHTAPVVDADPAADPPWMVTAYIPGPSLQEAVVRYGALPPEAIRSLGAGLAEGLAAIHRAGLVHRDLKPANVILASDGPRVIDFGIARALDGAGGVTHTGAVVGTFAYMSPEQVRAEPVGPAGDAFSLGCVLAFAATGHSPFDAGSIAAVVHRVTSEAPDLEGVPADHGLRDLIEACLAKAPAGRPSMGDVLMRLSEPGAGDLPPTVVDMITSKESQSRAALEGSGGHAATEHLEPPPQPQRAPSLIRRRAFLVGGLAAAAAVTVPVVVVLANSGDPGAAGAAPSRSATPKITARAEFATQTEVVVSPPAAVLTYEGSPGDPSVTQMDFSPDGKILACGNGSGDVRLWDVAARRSLGDLEGHDDAVRSVAFSPDGRTLASGGLDGTIRLWDVASRRTTSVLDEHLDYVWTVVFSPDGKTLASAGWDDSVRLWDVATGRTVDVLTTDTSAFGTAFSPDGEIIASSDDATVRLWDASTGRPVAVFPEEADTVDDIAFSPDGRTLAGASGDEVVLWDVGTRRVIGTLFGHTDSVTSVEFSPDGGTLASSSFDTSVRLWDMTFSRPTRVLNGHTDVVLSVEFSPDGGTLASGSGDLTVRLWDVRQ
ncbi:WD40 repeat domain-containing serine/threonine protein kinase [Planotetraspora kaengkrachanensis]|uniref:Protein kinase n=1 Tax=Planotetraspora kaengkrachanensis TaxID=575193 RepID=A0A8J3LWY7_9ACTN|nr:serine/threonine-protein kinase [Planotetraspora kaengkrachanensis]GIG79394.1 protein kinase [Planotetraspora kaengkrachanensis]